MTSIGTYIEICVDVCDTCGRYVEHMIPEMYPCIFIVYCMYCLDYTDFLKAVSVVNAKFLQKSS